MWLFIVTEVLETLYEGEKIKLKLNLTKLRTNVSKSSLSWQMFELLLHIWKLQLKPLVMAEEVK